MTRRAIILLVSLTEVRRESGNMLYREYITFPYALQTTSKIVTTGFNAETLMSTGTDWLLVGNERTDPNDPNTANNPIFPANHQHGQYDAALRP